MPRKKTTRKKRSSSSRKKFGDKFYTKDSCSTTKTGAKKTATSKRNSGKKARVVKDDGKWCVFTRG